MRKRNLCGTEYQADFQLLNLVPPPPPPTPNTTSATPPGAAAATAPLAHSATVQVSPFCFFFSIPTVC